MKVFQVQPDVSTFSHRQTPARSHPHHAPRLQTSSYTGGINLPSTGGPWERRRPCKHLKLKPVGQHLLPGAGGFVGTDATALERQVTSSASFNLCKHQVAMVTLQPWDAMAADGMGASRAQS